MSGQTGQLQRLTDEQVSARLAAYNGDGSLDRDLLRELWEEFEAELDLAAMLAEWEPLDQEAWAILEEASVGGREDAPPGKQSDAEKMKHRLVDRARATARGGGARVIEVVMEPAALAPGDRAVVAVDIADKVAGDCEDVRR